MFNRNIINTLIAGNVFVFCTWNYSLLRANGLDHDFRPLAWCHRNLTCSPFNLKERPWTLLTSAFSHSNLLHLGINCYVLHQFAPFLLSRIGKNRFIGFYAGSAIFSSLVSVWYKSLKYGSDYRQGSLGASGVVYSIMAVTAGLNRGMTVSLFGLIPLPINVAFAGMVGFDLISLFGNSRGTDSMGHLGGALGGYLYYIWKLKKYKRF